MQFYLIECSKRISTLTAESVFKLYHKHNQLKNYVKKLKKFSSLIKLIVQRLLPMQSSKKMYQKV
ncbi:hypothetical protein FD21_GL001850 [Liquorilactobacillus vini DSM 20605]|uniref:Uncharacterized protein n=1 Tax=Liquorilactobacillus vini DSM 20605 TaxID=1133569 RepID=A0A0R2C0K5_9LACO|nr:hypothetical protein FD21_GL001850 [Liquorilactobacillus vini DSM 20605]